MTEEILTFQIIKKIQQFINLVLTILKSKFYPNLNIFNVWLLILYMVTFTKLLYWCIIIIL